MIGLPEATYHYHVKKFNTVDPDQPMRELIKELFYQFKERYGYRRITTELKTLGHEINHKKVYRLMKEMGLKCMKYMHKSRRYNSYKGRVGKVARNRLNRRFDTPYPLQKVATDITEFKCTDDKKLYLSPILDLCNGEIITFGIGDRPGHELVMRPLEEAVGIINEHARFRTTIHSDQGWHYQHRDWVKTLKQHKIYQSMSRKATCADNASMENFFGLLKQEMYYGEARLSYNELKSKITEYIDWYNHIRSKEKLGGLSPVEYRNKTIQLAE